MVRAVVVPALGMSLAMIVAAGCERKNETQTTGNSTSENTDHSQIVAPGIVAQVIDTGVMPTIEVDATAVLPTTVQEIIPTVAPGTTPIVHSPGIITPPRPGIARHERDPVPVIQPPGVVPAPGVRVAPGSRAIPRPGPRPLQLTPPGMKETVEDQAQKIPEVPAQRALRRGVKASADTEKTQGEMKFPVPGIAGSLKS